MTSIIDKLQKLISHERSARTIGSISEAEAFAAKIQALLLENKLSMSEVEMDEEDRNEPVNEERVEAQSAGGWSGALAQGVASSCFCRVLRSGKSLIFIGSTSNRLTCISMFRYLATLGNSIVKSECEAWKQTEDYAYRSGWGNGSSGVVRTWKNSFLIGYANALYARLESERKKLTSDTSAGSGLVYIVRQESAVRGYTDTKYPNLRTGRRNSTTVDGNAYRQGYSHGSSVSTQSRAALGGGL